MSGERGRASLVGRLARIQVAMTGLALAATLSLGVGIASWVLGREQDRSLLGVAINAAEVLEEVESNEAERLEGELDEHRMEGMRLELMEAGGSHVAAVGDGPLLAPVETGTCVSQASGWRVCQAARGRFRVLAGRSEQAAIRTRNLVFAALAGVVLGIAGLVFGVGRAVARRALAPLAQMGGRISALQPGTGERLGHPRGLAELDALGSHFDALLERVDEALARERRFAAQASHELKTPLTVLRGEIESLAGPAAARALAATDELIGLVGALLVLSRAQSPFSGDALEVVNLADLVRDETGAQTAMVATRAIVLQAPDEALVAADDRLLRRAIANLIDNAIKFSPRDRPVEVTVEASGAHAEVLVSDEGPGVPTDLREHIFEPFFRGGEARAEITGHGLGLPLARAVARAHGGDVTLDDHHLPGARFRLRLPLVPV